MRIESVRIENFRSFEDATVPFNDYSCLVGPNGSGKSTVLTALNVFFRESENLPTGPGQLELEDFHCKNISTPIRITVTFCDPSEEAQDDFSDYVRQEKLVVTAVATFDEVRDMRPAYNEIIVCTALGTHSGIQYWGPSVCGILSDRRRRR